MNSRTKTGVVLMVAPPVLAIVALLVGLLTTSLALVYLSIALSVLWLPMLVVGIVMVVTAQRSRPAPPVQWGAPASQAPHSQP